MPTQELISYPKLPLLNEKFVEAFVDGEIDGLTLLKYGTEETVRASIVVRLLQDHEDPVFVVGEALQSPEDTFKKAIGRDLAETRALNRNELEEELYWSTFTLSEALETEEDMFGRQEEGGTIQVSKVVLPLSGLHLPHGIVNRLKMLLPKK